MIGALLVYLAVLLTVALPAWLMLRHHLRSEGSSVIPFGDRKAPQLATLSDGTEADLADEGEDEPDGGDFEEADEAELAAQASRPSAEQAKADAEAEAETTTH